VFDKDNGREVLRAGQMGNQLTVYVDGGDAWDFPADYDAVVAGSFSLVSSETWSDGPVAGIRQVRKFGASTMTQEIVIVSGSRRIDFKTHVDWREGDRMLRACFPIDVNSASARCEIQFGSIERPTHADTSWDAAKFEVCAHKWLDISESTYGVALLNDCKYGHRTLGGNLDINLLRSTGAPDPVADRAEHDFTYSLFPHTGDFARGGVVRAAYELNYPLRVATGDPKSTQLGRSLVTCDAESVVVESVKRAEDGGDVIVRLYEAHGSRVRASLKFASRICSASLVDLMEENPEPLEVSIDTVRVDLKPFEIVTLKIECEIGVSRS